MSDSFDERRRGLEEEYFRRKNKEAIAKLRERIKFAEAAKAAGKSSMQCPRCDGSLKETKVEEVLIDSCEKCGGVWLDSGELEKLTARETESGGWFSRLWNADE